MTIPIPTSSTPRPKPKKKSDKVARGVELAGQGVAGGVGSAFGAAKLRDSYLDPKDPQHAEHKEAFRHAIRRGAVRASRMGVPHGKIVAAAKTLHGSSPRFGALMVATGAATTATTAHHYQQLHAAVRRRKQQLSGIGKASAEVMGGQRRAPSPKIRVRVTPPAKHAPKPYVGAHRALSLGDTVKATAVLHSKHLAGAMEGIADLFKASCPRCAPLVAGEARYGHVEGLGKVQILGHHEGQIAHVLDRNDAARLVPTAKLRPHRPSRGAMTKNAFEIEKAHVLRDMAAVGGATAAGALLAKPALAASASKVAKARVIKPFARAYKNPASGGRPMPGSGIQKSVSPSELAKASAFGQSGDKRNTKYAGAAYGGAAAGGFAGRQIATRSAGTKPTDVARLARTNAEMKLPGIVEHATRHMKGVGEDDIRAQAKAGWKMGRETHKATMASIKDVPGGARMMRGGKAGAAGGAVAGTAAYVAHRRNRKVGMAKSSAFAKAAEKKKPSAGRTATAMTFPWVHSAAAGKKGKRLEAAASMTGHGLAGGVIGGAAGGVLGAATRRPQLAAASGGAGLLAGRGVGVHTNQRKGRYKPES